MSRFLPCHGRSGSELSSYSLSLLYISIDLSLLRAQLFYADCRPAWADAGRPRKYLSDRHDPEHYTLFNIRYAIREPKPARRCYISLVQFQADSTRRTRPVDVGDRLYFLYLPTLPALVIIAAVKALAQHVCRILPAFLGLEIATPHRLSDHRAVAFVCVHHRRASFSCSAPVAR